MITSQSSFNNLTAILFVMNDICNDVEDEFNTWYETQHVPERLAIDGFLSASRWHTSSRSQAYMATYRCSGTDTLEQPAYLERLENPTEWTRRMMPQFKNMVRSVCHETWAEGTDQGTHAIAIRCAPHSGKKDLAREFLITAMAERIRTHKTIARVALWEAAEGSVSQASPEETLRGERDTRVTWVVFIQTDALTNPSVQLNMSTWLDSPEFESLFRLEGCADYQRLSQHTAQSKL